MVWCSFCVGAKNTKGERSMEEPPPQKVVGEVVPQIATEKSVAEKLDDVSTAAQTVLKETTVAATPEKVAETVVEEVKKDDAMSVSAQMEEVLQSSPILRSLAETAGLVDETPQKTPQKSPPLEDTKASPAVLETVATLKGGVTLKKHSFHGGPKQRTIAVSDDELRLVWKDQKGSSKNLFAKKDKDVGLKEVKEVRPGTALDPETVGLPKRPKGMVGTTILRRSAEGSKIAKRAFSLILPDKTLDFETDDPAEATKLVAAFSYLVAKSQADDPPAE
mmetsp:Transcript_3809/g.11839  ORF Transcript_3809/g.11839 Transcript_3809/m.11839 type:complete len:277 (-) Transcript_3809:407-1237(-)